MLPHIDRKCSDVRASETPTSQEDPTFGRGGLAKIQRSAPIRVLAVASTALCAISPAQNNSGLLIDSGSSKMLKSRDIAFAMNAAQECLAEVELGKLAMGKGSSPEVKAFAQKMVDEDTKVNGQLTAIARKEEMTFPGTLKPEDQQLYNKLQRMSGIAFDRAYMKAMATHHKKDVKEFQKAAKKGKVPQVRAFASETLPVLESQLEMAKSIQVKVKEGA